MRIFVLVALAFFVTVCTYAESFEHRLKIAKVGDWVEMQCITFFGGKRTEETIKQEVTKRDGKGVTIRIRTRVMEKENQAREIFHPFNQVAVNQVDGTTTNSEYVKKSRSEILGEGNEDLLIKGKKCSCHWVKRKSYIDRPGQKEIITSTAWTCIDIPLCPLVKRIVVREGTLNLTTNEQLLDFGCGK
jgi:hypothetical protein